MTAVGEPGVPTGVEPRPTAANDAPGVFDGPGRPDFDRFYRANYAPAVRLALSLCGRASIAEEFAQDAFLAAHQEWATVGDLDRPDLWVRRVVINRSVSGIRRTRTERRLVERLGRLVHGSTPDVPVPDARLWRAVRALPRRQAQVVALRFVEDLTFPDIADVLQCSESTVRTHLRRALDALGSPPPTEETADGDL